MMFLISMIPVLNITKKKKTKKQKRNDRCRPHVLYSKKKFQAFKTYLYRQRFPPNALKPKQMQSLQFLSRYRILRTLVVTGNSKVHLKL